MSRFVEKNFISRSEFSSKGKNQDMFFVQNGVQPTVSSAFNFSKSTHPQSLLSLVYKAKKSRRFI